MMSDSKPNSMDLRLPQTSKQEDCPPAKKRRMDIEDVLENLRSLDKPAQFELWRRMLLDHPFDLDQLRKLRAAIDGRIRVDIISGVPYEIALYIMSFLSPKDLSRAAQTCRSWRVVCEDNRLWREKCREEGLLNDKVTLSTLFKNRIANRQKIHEKFARESIPASVTQSGWKIAYLKHMNILRNWKTRPFTIKEPFISSAQQDSRQGAQYRRVQGKPSRLRLSQSRKTYSRVIPVIHEEETRQQLMQLRCHEDSVITCLQFDPNTNTIVTGSDDQTLKVWSSESGRCISTLEGHTGGVWSSQLSPDGIVISGATDRTIKVWRAYTGELLYTFIGHSSTVRCLALNGDKVVSGSRDTTLRLWDIKKGVCINVLVGHTEAVRCVEYKGDTIVSGAYDCLVMVWDATTCSLLHSLDCHENRIYSLQFDGRTIASGSLDWSICIWDARSGTLRHQLEGHTSLTSKMQLKDNILVSANADSYCKVWDIEKGRCLHTLEDGPNKHTTAITSVYFDNRHVVTSSDDGTVKLWDIKTGQFIRNLLVLASADKGGVVWRIRGSYTKLICAVGSRTQTEDTHLIVLDLDD